MSQYFELVMPAGNLEKLKFAFAYGADAVYAGVPMFSLRARENSFTVEALKHGIEYAHSRGKKVYLTMNLFAHNQRVERFIELFQEMYDFGPDAFVMSDPGLIREARRLRPHAVIHLSTQANATNWRSVEFWRDSGVGRVILPRELSLTEITEISERVPGVELEVFVHGAICVAYSGRCLISNYLNHRDANTGTCTQACRWNYALAVERGSLLEAESGQKSVEQPYRPLVGSYYLVEAKRAEQNFLKEKFEIDEDEFGTYIMNSKDLCAIELLSDMHRAGVGAVKVEGRSKSEYYVAVIARAYRRAINDVMAGRRFNPDNLREAAATAGRTMMTGFLLKQPREYGENVEDGESLPLNCRYAGKLSEFDSQSGIAWVEFRNKVCLGDLVEWITPENTVSQRVETILCPDGAKVDSAHGGLLRGIPVEFELGEFTLLRQVLGPDSPVSESQNLCS